MTQQHFAMEGNVNQVVKRAQANLLPQGNRQPMFGDFTKLADYDVMLNRQIEARNVFNQFPAEIRERFGNSPQALYDWISDPKNREEAIEIGLLPKPVKRAKSAIDRVADKIDEIIDKKSTKTE